MTKVISDDQMVLQAFQPFAKDGFVVAAPTPIQINFAEGFMPPRLVDNTNNVVPTDRARLRLCGEEDIDHNGAVRPADFPTPILDAPLSAAVRIFDQHEPIGSGVLIADNIVLTAAHVANVLEKEPLRFVQAGRIARPGNGTRIEKIISLADNRVAPVEGLDLAVMLLADPIADDLASPTPILHTLSSEHINDAEAITAGYGDRDNLQAGLTFDLEQHLGEPIPRDEGSIRRGNRIMRTRACPADGAIPECQTWERLWHYEPMMQDGATMPFTACRADSGSAAFVQTDGVDGRLVVSAIFAVASGESDNGGCAKQMLFTDITAPDTQAELRIALAELDASIDVDSLFIQGELRRFGRIISAALE